VDKGKRNPNWSRHLETSLECVRMHFMCKNSKFKNKKVYTILEGTYINANKIPWLPFKKPIIYHPLLCP